MHNKLQCTVLNNALTVLYMNSALHCTALHCTSLHYTALYNYISLYYNVPPLHCTKLNMTELYGAYKTYILGIVACF